MKNDYTIKEILNAVIELENMKKGIESFTSNNYLADISSGRLTMLPFRATQWSVNDGEHKIYTGYTNEDNISSIYNSAMNSLQSSNTITNFRVPSNIITFFIP